MNNANMATDSGEWEIKNATVTPPIQVSRNRLGSDQKTATDKTIQAPQAGDSMDINGAGGTLAPQGRIQPNCQMR
jgi:hypothetical protein